MKLARPGHFYGLQPVKIGPARYYIGVGKQIGCADDVPFSGDQVGYRRPAPLHRLSSPDGEAQHIHLAGRLPLQEHSLALGCGGKGDQGDSSPGQGRQQEENRQKGGKQSPEETEESGGPPDPASDGPTEGVVGNRENLAPAFHPHRFPQERIRQPGWIGRSMGIPPGEDLSLRSTAQKAMEENAAIAPNEHDIARAQVIWAHPLHHHHITRAKNGVHAPSLYPHPQRARPTVIQNIRPF